MHAITVIATFVVYLWLCVQACKTYYVTQFILGEIKDRITFHNKVIISTSVLFILPILVVSLVHYM